MLFPEHFARTNLRLEGGGWAIWCKAGEQNCNLELLAPTGALYITMRHFKSATNHFEFSLRPILGWREEGAPGIREGKRADIVNWSCLRI